MVDGLSGSVRGKRNAAFSRVGRAAAVWARGRAGKGENLLTFEGD
jgi:hypothetical protein